MVYLNFFKSHIIEIIVGTSTLVAISAYTVHLLSKQRKKLTRIIDTIEVCNKPSVHIRDPDHVEEVLSMLIKGGAAKLQVISDFDYTLSRTHFNGIKCPSSFGILETGPLVPEDNKQKAKALFEYYYPIENDPNLSFEEKVPYLKEWYSKSLALLATSGLKREHIQEMVNLTGSVFRDGYDTFFRSLYSNDVPLLIFSAGVGDILKEMVKQENMLYPNVKIISNFLNFDSENNISGFKNELIHTFNKNLSSLENGDYFEHLKSRHNVILLGDSLGDLDMAEGIKEVNCILKIGFLNSKVQENMQKYMKSYDIVLVDDQTLDVTNALLQHIL